MSEAAQPTAPSPSATDPAIPRSTNLVAEALVGDGVSLNTNRHSADDQILSLEDQLPVSQRMSPVMIAAHSAIERQFGPQLATLTLAEMQALQTRLTLQEKHLLTTSNPTELFSDVQPHEASYDESAAKKTPPEPAGQSAELSGHRAEEELRYSEERLSPLEYAQIRQENSDLSGVVCVRATADLIKELRRSDSSFDLPGRSQGKTPLTAAVSFVASALKLTYSTVDKRLTAAATIWPNMAYRRSHTTTPQLATHLEQGRIQFDAAIAARDKLTKIRQAVRRAGGDETAADDMVRHKERDFIRHALRNNSHTFGRYAKAQSDAVTNELIGPTRSLTNEQIKHEKGIFYDSPIGDSLHRLTVVVDEGELLQLTAIREFSTKLDSVISTLRAQAHDTCKHPTDTASETSGTKQPEDEEVKSPRLTPEDIDYGIGKLFDGQTKAERWLNTLMDFASAALMLHKTYDPHATAEEQRRRDTALQRAAEHSEVLTDILGVADPPDMGDQLAVQHEGKSATDAEEARSEDMLSTHVPAGYQLLRPNLDLIVEISLRDLVELGPKTARPGTSSSKDTNTSELDKILGQLQQEERGLTVPRGSPGSVTIDYGLARQQACHQRIIPMILGSASQPLDVGRAQRSFSAAMRRALHVRDRGCVVPGCPRPASWCEPHHLEEWAQGGVTSIRNGVLLCRQHHSSVHKGLLQVHMEADGRASCSLPLHLDPSQTRYRNVYWTA